MHHVYILKSKVRNKIYIGCTNNLKRRIAQHNTGKVFASKRDYPFELVYCETYKNKHDAFEREHKLKYYGQALRRLKERISNSLD